MAGNSSIRAMVHMVWPDEVTEMGKSMKGGEEECKEEGVIMGWWGGEGRGETRDVSTCEGSFSADGLAIEAHGTF